MIQAAIFDMDGVLIDNLDYHKASWKRLGEEIGVEITDEKVESVFGRRNQEMLQSFLDKTISAQELGRLANRKEELYRQVMAPRLQDSMVGGLQEFLRRLRQATFRIALATSGPLDNVEMVLEGLRIAPYFEAIVTGSEVTKGKPDPEVFLLASGKLNVDAMHCVVFEDSPSGIQAALRAGCVCVALATSHTAHQLQEYEPAVIISDFKQLQVEDIRHLDDSDPTRFRH